jgi:hypothetical protein
MRKETSRRNKIIIKKNVQKQKEVTVDYKDRRKTTN